jgi:hypothetical protein
MDIQTPQNTQPERDQTQDQLDMYEAPAMPHTPEEKTRSIPEDPDARKMFIQEVCKAKPPLNSPNSSNNRHRKQASSETDFKVQCAMSQTTNLTDASPS